MSTADHFIASVLRLQPCVAAFDCDGTLWSGDLGESFFDWEIKEGVVSGEIGRTMRNRYSEYRAGKVSEEDMCGEMVTMNKGISDAEMTRVAADFFDKFFLSQIFPDMRELVRRLQETSCEVWAISSSSEWLIRAGMKHLGIPDDRILATKVVVDKGVITDRLVRIPSGLGKPKAIHEVVKKNVDAAFGNSRWDSEMLAIAKHAFAINPNPDLEASARQKGWPIYFPDGKRR